MINLSIHKKQVVVLYLSTLLGVLLGVVASIINTKFLLPTDYGDVRYVQNIINFISSLLIFGYFWSGSRLLAVSKNEQKSRQIRGVLIIIMLITFVLMCMGLFLCYLFHLNTKPIVANLFLLSIPVCGYPIFSNYINNVAQGDNQIGRIALCRVLPMLIYIPIAYFSYTSYGGSAEKLILLQWGIYSLVLLFIVISTSPSFRNLTRTFYEIRTENKEYGFQLYYGSIIMVATNYLAGVFIGIFNKDNVEVGYYTLALTVTSPLSMLPAIIGTTYFKEFASRNRIPRRVFVFTIGISILSLILFILFIRPLVVFFYSKDYAGVGTYAQWMALGFSIHGVGDMINRYLSSHGQGKPIRNSSIINGLFKIFGFTVLVYYFNTKGAIITNVFCSILYCSLLLIYYIKFVKGNSIISNESN